MSDPTPRQASYVYAVTRALDPADVAHLAGVDGAEVHLVAQESLVAVVSSVPLAEFDEAALRAKLERMAELEAIARAHHGVVDAAAAHGATLPLRLATIYRDDTRVAEMLRDGYARFVEALDRLTGRVEWGVKVYVDSTEMPPATVGAGSASSESAGGAGKDYLRRRREQRRSRDDAWRRAADLGSRVDDGLAALAVDLRHYRAQNPELSGARGENVLNAAYLVDTARSAEFAAEAQSLDGSVPGTRVELTGPWAPYSFALPPEEMPDDPAEPVARATEGGDP